MSITRRKALAILAGALPAAQSLRMFGASDVAKGPFQPTRESLSTCRVPEWFRDAKFGMWMFNESKRKAFTTEDIRFTSKGHTLYAFVMGWPEPRKGAVIAPLGTGSKYAPGKIEHVELLGFPGKLRWTRDESGLRVQMPEQKPSEHAVALRISRKGLT